MVSDGKIQMDASAIDLIFYVTSQIQFMLRQHCNCCSTSTYIFWERGFNYKSIKELGYYWIVIVIVLARLQSIRCNIGGVYCKYIRIVLSA